MQIFSPSAIFRPSSQRCASTPFSLSFSSLRSRLESRNLTVELFPFPLILLKPDKEFFSNANQSKKISQAFQQPFLISDSSEISKYWDAKFDRAYQTSNGKDNGVDVAVLQSLHDFPHGKTKDVSRSHHGMTSTPSMLIPTGRTQDCIPVSSHSPLFHSQYLTRPLFLCKFQSVIRQRNLPPQTDHLYPAQVFRLPLPRIFKRSNIPVPNLSKR